MPQHTMLYGYLSLGSNMGDPTSNIHRALSLIDQHLPGITASPLYRTEPQGLRDQAWFVNCVARVNVPPGMTPEGLLQTIRAVEEAMGRVRTLRWGPRSIDVDILLVDGWNVQREDLQIPHPRMLERAFVLVPLAELAPELLIAGQPAKHWLSRIRYRVEGDVIHQPEPKTEH